MAACRGVCLAPRPNPSDCAGGRDASPSPDPDPGPGPGPSPDLCFSPNPSPIPSPGPGQVVEALLAQRRNPRQPSKRQFLVRWYNYPPEQDSWENEANIFDRALIRAFEASALPPTLPPSRPCRPQPASRRAAPAARRPLPAALQHTYLAASGMPRRLPGAVTAAELPRYVSSTAFVPRDPTHVDPTLVLHSELASEIARDTAALLTAAAHGPLNAWCWRGVARVDPFVPFSGAARVPVTRLTPWAEAGAVHTHDAAPTLEPTPDRASTQCRHPSAWHTGASLRLATLASGCGLETRCTQARPWGSTMGRGYRCSCTSAASAPQTTDPPTLTLALSPISHLRPPPPPITTRCTAYDVRPTPLRPVPYVLCPAPYALHSAPCTLCSAPCTLRQVRAADPRHRDRHRRRVGELSLRAGAMLRAARQPLGPAQRAAGALAGALPLPPTSLPTCLPSPSLLHSPPSASQPPRPPLHTHTARPATCAQVLRPAAYELRQHMVLVASEPIEAGAEIRIDYEDGNGGAATY